MANEPRKPMSWKNPTTAPGAAPGKGPAPSQKREWHPTTPVVKASGPRRKPILLTAVFGATLLGMIVAAVLLLRPPKTPRLVVFGPAALDTLAVPHNVAGANAVAALADWTNAGKDRPRLVQAAADAVTGDEWARGIDDGKEEAVVLYLGLHGGADEKGPFLWLVPPGLETAGDKQKLRLETVLERLAKLPAKTRKLLILDATQIPVHYALGQLHNNFVRALKAMDAEIDRVPNLVVLCSSDEDQRSWVSEEWQQPIFTHYLIEGAKGAAKTDRVTVAKLYEYLKEEVAAWVRANRGEKQVPLLLPTGTGIDRAKKIELASVRSSGYQAPAPSLAPGASFAIPRDLAAAWQRREDLSAKAPQTNAPNSWRRHLDSLLRAESMLRTGSTLSDVSALLSKLRRAENDLSQNPWPELSSSATALPMPVALGTALPKPMLDSGRFQTLWADPVNNWPVLRQSVEGQGEAAVTRLRLEVSAHLLEFLIREDQPAHLKNAAELLRVVFVTLPAPSEVHPIRVLQRDVDAPARVWPMIRQFLEVHRLAEETGFIGGAAPGETPSIEHVYPWIRDGVAVADIERLRGFDLLLSNNPADWTKAAERLTLADGQYRAILKQAKQVREAIAARNMAMAELPYYGRWVAGLRDEFEFDAEANRKLLEQVERIAESSHRLSGMLEEASPARLGEMNAAAILVREELDKLRATFFAFIDKLNAEALISRWHHIDNALQVPFIPAKRRMELLANLRAISSDLNAKERSASKSAASGNEFSPQSVAQRHGRVSLALLGTVRVDDRDARKGPDDRIRPSFGELHSSLTQASENWTKSLGEVGEHLGAHWRRVATQTDKLSDKAARGTIDEALRDFAQADTQARLVDSATALSKASDPVADYRRYRLHDFLLAQARRTIAANWAAIDSTNAFAEETARLFVNDAEKLILGEKGASLTPGDRLRLLAAVKPVRDALAIARYDVQPAELTKPLTDQQKNVRLNFSLIRPAGQPAGFPVVRFTSGGLARVPTSESSARRPVPDFVDGSADRAIRTLDVEILPKSSVQEQSFVAAELRHRGHLVDRRTVLEVDREPSGVWVYKPPSGQSTVAARADPEMRGGSVGICLDWSYSMTNNKLQVNRYKAALAALRSVLASLPRDTVVSLIQFGEPDPATTARPSVRRGQPRNFQDNKDQLDELMKELEDNPPKGVQSPIARAIADMAADQAIRSFPGFRTIIVLTDGEDNVDGDEAGEIAYRALQKSPGVSLKVVFFQAGDEEANARRQFARVLDHEPRPEFYSVRDQRELISSLRNAMLPRVRVFQNGVRLPEAPLLSDPGLKVTAFGDNTIAWSEPLAGGTYDLRTANSLGAKMVLDRGDRLLLELFRDGSQIRFRPQLYVPTVIPKDGRNLRTRSGGAQEIHAGLGDIKLVANPDSPSGYDLDLQLLLERDRRPDEMQVTRPQFTWMEVRTQDEKQPVNSLRLRMENELYLPSPAFRLTVWNWQPLPGQPNVRLNAASPAITVWWRDSFPKNPTLFTRDVNKSLRENFEGRTFTKDGKLVKIESIRMEQGYLQLEVSHPPGSPVVFVRPEDLTKEPSRLVLEEEHRFYEKSGKYTARFGPLNEDDQKRAFTLAFYSMDELKQDATKVELRPNYKPDVSPPLGDATPRPIIRLTQ